MGRMLLEEVVSEDVDVAEIAQQPVDSLGTQPTVETRWLMMMKKHRLKHPMVGINWNS